MDAPPATELVTLDIEGDQASITLTRAEKYNALNVAMIQELIALFEWTAERSVTTGHTPRRAGEAFFAVPAARGEGSIR